MRVSIIIPIYNITNFFKEALESAVSQTYAVHTIIVVDDGSTPDKQEEIAQICRLFPEVILLRTEHKGAAAARHFGISQSTDDAIIFLDADDVLKPHAVDYLVSAMQKHKNAIAVYARVQQTNSAGYVLDFILPHASHITSGAEVLHYLLEKKVPFCNGSICIKRATLLELPVCNQQFIIGEDWVLWCYLALQGHIQYAGDEVVLLRRKHPNNITRNSLQNPELIWLPQRMIANDPIFVTKVGEQQMRVLSERYIARTHMYLSSIYAKILRNPQLAQQHLQKITIPLSEIVDGYSLTDANA